MNDDHADEEWAAFWRFCMIRWRKDGGEPTCPRCRSHDYYLTTTRRRFRCKDCCRDYTPTAGTAFNGRKMTYREIVTALDLLLEREWTVHKLAERMGWESKTAWHFMNRLKQNPLP
jgi:transposase-like protein